MGAGGGTGAAGRAGVRRKATIAVLSGSLAVLPALVVSDSTARWLGLTEDRTASTPLAGGRPSELNPTSVDGSLPEAVTPEELRVHDEPVKSSLGIPESVLDAYRSAAARITAEYPGCNLDWALLASIGRIESNHARGGYVDTAGDTLEPILGPVLDGKGNVAAIADTDGGRYDGDTTWDRAVGPMQFIPSTWRHYAADGNGDGVTDPNNVHDAALAAGRYLCSGGFDLSDSQQLRTAVYRYNNSWAYVDTVIRWAKAYRNGVMALPDSELPAAVPETLLAHGAGQSHDVSSGAQPPSGGREPSEPPKPSGPSAPSPGGSETVPEESTDPGTPDENDGSTPPKTEPTNPPATEPTDPEDPPTEPEDPPTTDPTDPTEPPTEPEDPTTTDPTDPTDPPTDPEDPPTTEPGDCDPDGDEGKTGDGESTPTESPEPSTEPTSSTGTTTDSASSTGETADPTDEADPTDPPCEDEESPEDGTAGAEQTSATKEQGADED
ncbi:lytic murein transglycosylase [Saccharomonospora cyanea]|uniref:Transglycosylase family protein n=1 Tax=Saccharomonospora cyanea NA-134 TaxID=882082 RepID=H5XM33_9PSEU|nr:lytic murein transglycosylase [Saccharomonospora cyanea]EHR63112.1 transglycosylase family protein [Saccharomonospora cyanea NA-134]